MVVVFSTSTEQRPYFSNADLGQMYDLELEPGAFAVCSELHFARDTIECDLHMQDASMDLSSPEAEPYVFEFRVQLDSQRPAAVTQTGNIRPDDFGAETHLRRDQSVVGVGEGE